MSDKQTPPAGYSKLPDGTRCRCVKLWQSDDGFYCCKPRVPAMTDRINHCTGCKERQDRIEALTAENERLRQFAQNAERCAAHGLAGDWSIALHDIKREARAALGDKQ